jgi:hypothetical protein
MRRSTADADDQRAAAAREIAAAFAEVELDLGGSDRAWSHHGGRPLDRLVEDARRDRRSL